MSEQLRYIPTGTNRVYISLYISITSHDLLGKQKINNDSYWAKNTNPSCGPKMRIYDVGPKAKNHLISITKVK